MDHIRLQARGKVNLALNVIGKRPDGYHELDTVMAEVGLCDVIEIKKIHKPDYLKVITDANGLPTDERNIAYRAADFMIKTFGLGGVFIDVHKRIPIAAGLGGGSADCAAVLRGMAELFALDISDGRLAEIGRTFGADVPFCLTGGIARAKGIGEELEPLPPLNRAVVIIKPTCSASTADVFKRLRLDDVPQHKRPNVSLMADAIKRRDMAAAAGEMKNVLETVTEADYPIITDIKNQLTLNGALGAVMSGSGTATIGLFPSIQAAKTAAAALRDANIGDVFAASI